MSRPRTDRQLHGSTIRRAWTVPYLTITLIALASVVGCHDPSDPTPIVPDGGRAAAAVGSPGLTAPSSANAAAVSLSQIDISWTDESQKETGFQVQRAIGPSGAFTPLATTAANPATYRDQAIVCPA